jgi:integrase
MATGKRRDGIQERRNADGTVTYRAQVRLRGHPPITKSFTRRTDAKAWVEATKTAIRKGDILSTEADRTTLGEALGRYMREVTPKKKDKKREEARIKAWQRHSLAVRYLSKLRGSDFAEYRDARLKEGKANNTVSLELKLISAVYKTASREWKMEGLRNPIRNVTMPGGSNQRDRRLSADEQSRLLDELRNTPYMSELAELAIESAMRQGELLSLTWADIDKEKRIAHLRDTKNSEPRDVPLSTRALAIIEALPRAIKHDSPVFPLSQDFVIRTFRAACTVAEIENLKFHDLRHEATSRICDRLPMHEAMRITGHKTPSMLMRYYHPKAEDLARKLG